MKDHIVMKHSRKPAKF